MLVDAFTVTVNVFSKLLPSVVLTLIVVDPSLTPVIKPVDETVAIFLSLAS